MHERGAQSDRERAPIRAKSPRETFWPAALIVTVSAGFDSAGAAMSRGSDGAWTSLR